MDAPLFTLASFSVMIQVPIDFRIGGYSGVDVDRLVGFKTKFLAPFATICPFIHQSILSSIHSLIYSFIQ